MKKVVFLLIIALLGLSTRGLAQKYITKTGHISFYSDAPLEDIEAQNDQVNAALDVENGDFVFKVLMKSFEFEQALMQEHFNENYVESDKFPNSTFKGKVLNISDINFASEGSYEVNVNGDLNIHGVTNEVNCKGTFVIGDGHIRATAVFEVSPEDYKISIPSAVAENIAKTIEVTVEVDLAKYDQVAQK